LNNVWKGSEGGKPEPESIINNIRSIYIIPKPARTIPLQKPIRLIFEVSIFFL
jgi:hypothetical protein